MKSKRTVKIKAWMIVQKDSGDYWDGQLYHERTYAQNARRNQTDEYKSFSKFLKVVPCTITYSLPKKK